jgi:hypothetical protein
MDLQLSVVCCSADSERGEGERRCQIAAAAHTDLNPDRRAM